jgi:hypothetical protein
MSIEPHRCHYLWDVSEASLQFEPNAGNRRRFCRANDDPHIIAVTAEWLEATRVYLGAPEAEGRYDMQTKEMPTVRPKCSPRPAARLEHFDNLQVAGKPVAVDGIEQQDISVAPQALGGSPFLTYLGFQGIPGSVFLRVVEDLIDKVSNLVDDGKRVESGSPF